MLWHELARRCSTAHIIHMYLGMPVNTILHLDDLV